MDEQENLVNIMVQDTELDLPILVVRSFEVDVCVRGLHFFKNFPDVGTTLSVSPEDDPMSLVHDRYAIAVKMADSRKIGHVVEMFGLVLTISENFPEAFQKKTWF